MIRWLHHRLIRPILTAHDSPEAVAGGVAWGVGIALTPTLGVQMPIALFVSTMARCNRLVAVAMVWISNPLTALPLYYGEYLVGVRLLGVEGLSFQDFSERWSQMSGLAYLERFKVLFNVLTDVAVPLLVGSGVVAVLAAVICYPTMLVFLRRRRARLQPQPAESVGKSALGGLGLMLGLSALSACAPTGKPGEVHGVVDEVSIAERHPVWYAELDGGVLAVLTPFHRAEGRQEFTRQRLDAMLGLRGLSYLALELYSLDPSGPRLALGEDGVPVSARQDAGRITSLRPSKALGAEIRPAHRVVLAPLLGPGELPELEPGSALRFLVLMPTERGMADLDEWELELPGGAHALAEVEVEAAAYEAFLTDPSSESFRRSWSSTGG